MRACESSFGISLYFWLCVSYIAGTLFSGAYLTRIPWMPPTTHPYNPRSSGARHFLLPFLHYYCSLCVAGSRCWKAETNFLLPQTLYSITPKVLVTRARLLSLPYSLPFCFRRPSTTRTNIILAKLKHGALGEFIISLLAVQFHLIAVQ
jgi:hypothetical protein